MQNESVAQSQFPRFEQNVERIPDTWDATRAPDLVSMNPHAIWACWRNIVLIVMMGEVDVVHANPPDACIRMRQDPEIGWPLQVTCTSIQRNKPGITRNSHFA